MSTLNLRQRLLIVALLPSTLVAMILAAYFTLSSIEALEDQLHANGVATARYLAPISEYGIIAGQSTTLNALVQATMQTPDIKAAIIVNKKGKIIAVSGRVSLPNEVLRQTTLQPMLVAEDKNWIAYSAPVWRSLVEPDLLFDQPGLPDNVASEVIGQIFVELDKSRLIAEQHDLLLRGIILLLVSLMLISFMAIRAADQLSRPLLRLANAVRSMSGGNFSTRVPKESTGEIGELERGFNEMAGQIQDINESLQQRIEAATAQLAMQARHDMLTGLINRREFERRLEAELELVKSSGEPASLLFIDLDRFKPVNDACGHAAGDELLKQYATLFQSRLRGEDTLARVGGDEFAILLTQCDMLRAKQVADDLCQLSAAYRFIWHDKVFAVGASIGLTQLDENTRNIAELLAAADGACYQAKALGRNQSVTHFGGQRPNRRKEQHHWENRIVSALNDGRLLLEALPVVPLQAEAGKVPLVEISARLNEPGQPSVALSSLLDAAERYELAPMVDRKLIDAGIRARAIAGEHHRPLACLVPISQGSLAAPDTLDYIRQALAAAGISGEGLYFAISEESCGRHASQVNQFARDLREIGCDVAFDNIGDGASSFSQMRAIRPKFIKIGRNLTAGIEENRAATALLRAVQEIAEDAGIVTIAGNIAESRLLPILAGLKINYVQGLAAGPCEPLDVWLEGALLRDVPV
jgi:diguanylate cyclase (GGDEF)-like protein